VLVVSGAVVGPSGVLPMDFWHVPWAMTRGERQSSCIPW
jgi:hypothetical protein